VLFAPRCDADSSILRVGSVLTAGCARQI
jgi:hypothetical protein